MSGLGLLTVDARLCLPRLEVLGVLLVVLGNPDEPLLVLPLPLLELDEASRSMFELADFTFDLG